MKTIILLGLFVISSVTAFASDDLNLDGHTVNVPSLGLYARGPTAQRAKELCEKKKAEAKKNLMDAGFTVLSSNCKDASGVAGVFESSGSVQFIK